MSSPPRPGPIGDDPPLDRGEADAVLLVERVGGELIRLSLAVEELQATLGSALKAAAAHLPVLMRQAQKLDLVAQSLQGLSIFLAAV